MATTEQSEDVIDVAYHETGHFLGAWHLGISPQSKGVTVAPCDKYLGQVSLKWRPGKSSSVPLTDRDRLKMERFVMASLASEVVRRRQRPETCTESEFRCDRLQVNDAFFDFEIEEPEASAYIHLLRIRTENLFARPIVWAQVEALAAALVERKTLSAKAAIQIAKEGSERWMAAERANPTPWTPPPPGPRPTAEEMEEMFTNMELRAEMRGE